MKRFTFNDQSIKNSYGFYVDTDGVSLSRFNDNPICLNDHSNSTKDVLGKWENLKVENGLLSGVAVFDTEDPEGKEVVRKVNKGTINGCSMGIFFDSENLVLVNGELRLTACELYEVSIVAVPSNAKAIALYSQEGELLTDQQVQKLCLSVQKRNPKTDDTMKKVNLHLQLDEAANEEATLQAIKAIEANLKVATTERDTYKLKAENLEKAENERLEGLFTAELAAAQKDGRIDAGGTLEKSILKLKESDSNQALEMLKALPKHTSVQDNLKDETHVLAAYDKQTWGELDKGNMLAKLKADHPDYYKERFKQEFGREPQA